ncbi:hypothetical protein FEM48_Zijuj12G0027100 [Ziziphus jujuba var. spinosa]|uniref:DUF295 domain-containing protein n=1 Tax=Ziziphus jujuba var. spinosa TaxID=714518 RepID=A0A978UAR4_ZIZJJ|nr:hypothetical protein FEM48_Zijuj12G0027100 [Ziziphus jujuba var. spinosa]
MGKIAILLNRDINLLDYRDVAFHNGRFYAVDCMGLTIAVDPSSLKLTQVAPLMHQSTKNESKLSLQLHKFDGQLGREENQLSTQNTLWRHFVNSLGNLFLIDKFVEYSFHFDVEDSDGGARDSAGLKNNCIYFTYRSFSCHKDGLPGCVAGFFDLDDYDTQPLESAVGYSQIFRPTPSWLERRSS